jgi:D-aspartate ligase
MARVRRTVVAGCIGCDGRRPFEISPANTRNPGCVLCPTSDDVAFLVAAHVESLRPLFRLFTPSRDALLQMLDKSRLAEAADRAGLKSPETWSPRTEDELRAIVSELPLPVLVKPRAHVLSQVLGKPVLIRRREDIVPAWRAVRHADARQVATTGIPDLAVPILQARHAVSERIYTVDGFVDASGTIVAAAACVKTMQLPRRSGPGICFETAPMEAHVLAGLQRLCRLTRYRGVFDAEFLIAGEDKLLIDFNPRFYHHMAFEIERNLPLPWLAYLAAIDDQPGLRLAIAALAVEGIRPGRIYAHRFLVATLLTAQRAVRGMTSAEVRRWWEWIAHADQLTNPAYVPGDPMPACAEIAYWLRRPRSFLRKAAAR